MKKETLAESNQNGAADLVFRNGRIYTVNPNQPWAEAVAVKEGRLVRVGSNDDVQGLIGTGTEVVDLGDRLMIPGLHDSHVHLIAAVHYNRSHCQLPEYITNPGVDDYLAAIRKCYQEGGGMEDGWFLGGAWFPVVFGKKGPTKEMLDEILGDTPAFLVDTTLHAAWVNSAALKVAGIDKNTPDPQFGLIGRDPKTGEPTGYLVEYGPMAEVGRHIPRLPIVRRMALAEQGIAELNSYGVVGFCEAGSEEADLFVFNQLSKNGRLNARVTTRLIAVQAGCTEETLRSAEDIAATAVKYNNRRLNTMGAKIYVDGIPMIDNIAYLERKVPFDESWLYEDLTISPEKLKQVVTDLDRNGLQIMMHCVGDKACRVALDAIEAAQKTNGTNDLRHDITHFCQVSDEDLARYSQLGVYLCPQTWLSTDNDFRDDVLAIVGEEGWNKWFSYRTLFKTGACISIGSDWPCGPSNPYPGLYMASTRIDPLHPERGAFREEEKLTIEELIPMLTINGAKLMHTDDVSGSIEEGKFADLVVLDRNILKCAPEELVETRVLVTLLEGQPVYHAEDSPMLPLADALKTPEMWR